MHKDDITHLVVGAPVVCTFGVVLTQGGEHKDFDSTKSLRWKNGAWESAKPSWTRNVSKLVFATPGKKMAEKPAKLASKWMLSLPSWTKNHRLRYAAELALVLAIGLPVALYLMHDGQTEEVPVAELSGANEGAAIPTRQVDSPYQPEIAQIPIPGKVAEAQLPESTPVEPVPIRSSEAESIPVVHINAQAQAATDAPVAPAPTNQPVVAPRATATAKVTPTVAAKGNTDRKLVPEQVRPQVAAVSQAPLPASVAPATQVNKEAPVVSGKKPKDSEPQKDFQQFMVFDDDVKHEGASPKQATASAATPQTVAAQPGAATESGKPPIKVGLVAIMPDGKSALFTDPKTRLPMQYRPGDRLANGETVKSIDLKVGKVTTDAKDYKLE